MVKENAVTTPGFVGFQSLLPGRCDPSVFQQSQH
ncbi:MAG: hypothetical protein ACI8P0_006586 [Planctomycetaceae bacterium]|jgi:hypothetical protein